MADGQTAIKIERQRGWVRVGPALCVNGTWCFDPSYRPTRCSSQASVQRATTMWKNRLGTDLVAEDLGSGSFSVLRKGA